MTVAEPYPSTWAWDNVPEDAEMPGEGSYEVLRDTVIAAFNPPDEDAAEEAIMTDAIDRAWTFIVAQPCTCDHEGEFYDIESCARCEALGRRRDKALER